MSFTKNITRKNKDLTLITKSLDILKLNTEQKKIINLQKSVFLNSVFTLTNSEEQKKINDYGYSNNFLKKIDWQRLYFLENKKQEVVGITEISAFNDILIDHKEYSIIIVRHALDNKYRGLKGLNLFENVISGLVEYKIANLSDRLVGIVWAVSIPSFLLGRKYLKMYQADVSATSNAFVLKITDLVFGKDRKFHPLNPILVKRHITSLEDKKNLEKTNDKIINDPLTQYFIENNPDYRKGWSLPIFVPITCKLLLQFIETYEKLSNNNNFFNYEKKILNKNLSYDIHDLNTELDCN